MSGCEKTVILEEYTSHIKTNILGFSKKELILVCEKEGLPAFRAQQIYHWIYQKGVHQWEDMTNLSKEIRAKFSNTYDITLPIIKKDLVSEDGTRKWLIAFADGNEVEIVYIPEEERGTLCISSQVGCTLTCKFCHTGTQRLVRNLTSQEIIAQIVIARSMLHDWPSSKPDRLVTNIVLMGMGEPLYNYENVSQALRVIMEGDGLAISKRKITLSTSGVVPEIERCGEELGVSLAVSLHAVTDKVRDILVPLNKKYPIATLLDACRKYPGAHHARRITFEYVMLKDVNDADEDAYALVELLRDIPAKVNLIPFNPWPGSLFECSSSNRIHAFARIIVKAGYPSPVRTPRGRDILAACGQLKSETVKLRKSLTLKAQEEKLDALYA